MLPQDEYTTPMIVTLGLDIGISHQEHRKNEGYDIPSREDKPKCQ